MPRRRPSPHVPAQYYGYSLQCTHFVHRLLDADPGSVVSLEVLEDVASRKPSGALEAVQVKSGRESNPTSDHSPELWKTFSNWITAVQAGEIRLEETSFELYVGRARSGRIATRLSQAKTESEATSVIAFAREQLLASKRSGKKRDETAATVHKTTLTVLDKKNEKIFSKIVERFTLTGGSGHAFPDLLDKFKKALIDDDIAEDVLLHGLGWGKKR